MKLKTHRYRGMTILPSTYGLRRWYVQTYHQTGIAWAEGECRHFENLADARRWIDEQRREEVQL